MRIGYARVSTHDQHAEAQVARLKEAGCERVFADSGVSGARTSRPEWDKCLDHLRAGDQLVAVRLDRIGRSVRNLIDVAADLQERGVDLVCLDQPIDTTSPQGKLFYTMLAAFAAFERDLIVERTQDGLAAARERGAKLGRPAKLSPDQAALVADMAATDPATGRRRHPVREIAALLKVHPTTIYDYLRAAS
jgi:DNA invertase Pin-like site-specific DNA recombinase